VPDDDLIVWSKHVAQLRLFEKHLRYVPAPIDFMEDIPILPVVSTVVM
jgi:hypothetical protein